MQRLFAKLRGSNNKKEVNRWKAAANSFLSLNFKRSRFCSCTGDTISQDGETFRGAAPNIHEVRDQHKNSRNWSTPFPYAIMGESPCATKHMKTNNRIETRALSPIQTVTPVKPSPFVGAYFPAYNGLAAS